MLMGTCSGNRLRVLLAALFVFALLAAGCSSDSAPAGDGSTNTNTDDTNTNNTNTNNTNTNNTNTNNTNTNNTTPDAAPDTSEPDATPPDATPDVAADAPPPDATTGDLPLPPTDAELADIVVVDSAPPPPGCGNGTRDPNEECDDGNTTNLDGCSSACTFEQIHRVNALKLQYNTSSFCSQNAFGGAITSQLAQGLLQGALDDSVSAGDMNVLMMYLILDDLAGNNDPLVVIGMLDATPVADAAYDGAADLDWWYTISSQSIDANRMPLSQINGSITSNVLEAGPASLSFPLALGGGPPSMLSVSHARIRATLSTVDSPTISSTGGTPGHLPSENLDPGLLSFAATGVTSGNASGDLCGNVSAAALALVPVPELLTAAPFGCQQGYTTANSMLDLIVGGCNTMIGQIIAPTQPDSHDPLVLPAGAGPTYTLSATGSVVDGCKDNSGQTVTLADCLADAAYSISFKFSAGRVIGK